MTKIKLCGLTHTCDIETVNLLKPEYAGFVFAEKSRRYVSPEKAAELRKLLLPEILAVGVFVNAPLETVERLLREGIIDLAQLHGEEDAAYMRKLKKRTGKPLIKAFRVRTEKEVEEAEKSAANYVLLDSGAGSGAVFDWHLLKDIQRPFFLAGGLDAENVIDAIKTLRPFAVDVSSGIETDGKKDRRKMEAFVEAVRKGDRL